MEPLAPGTEDELVDFNSLNKQETENDRLLKLKAVLKNGQYENIFELSYLNGCEHWFCKVCECPIMGRVYQHELGRRHSQNMAATYRNHQKEVVDTRTKELSDDSASRLDIAPGEPVPPGFEGEVNRQAQIQERLDGFKVGPLVALEYLLEMRDYDPSKEPSYLCILCDKKGDPRTVLTHLASYNHISQYLQKHFPTCYRALAPYMTKVYKRNWQGVLQKIAEAIEKKFGRLRPFCIDQDKFEKDRMYFLSMISKGKHFSEQNGPSFVELIVHEELTKSFDDDGRIVKTEATSFGGKAYIEREPVKPVKPVTTKRSPSPPFVARPSKRPRAPVIESKRSTEAGRPINPDNNGRGRRRSLSSVSSISSDDGQTRDGRRLARNRSPPPRDARRQYDNRDNRGGLRRRTPSPKRKSIREEEERERRKNREKERLQKLEEFNKLSKAIETDIEKSMKQYEKNPEKHPKYNDEWKLFWNRRYKELQAEGKDAAKHDFKPEWIQFWGKRMRELSDEDHKNRKDGLRRRLGLPDEVTPISFRIGGGGGPAAAGNNAPKPAPPKENRPNLPMAARPDNDPEIIILDDKDDMPRPKKIPANRDVDRSHSPWESDTSPPRTAKGRRLSRSPESDKRRGGRPTIRSRERSFERRPDRSRRSPDRGRKSPERGRKSPDRGRKSPGRGRMSPDRGRKSPDRVRKSPERGRMSPERGRMSPDRGRKSLDRGRKSPERGRMSPERGRRSSDRQRRSRSRDLAMRISKDRSQRRSPGRSRDRDIRSRSPDSYKGGKSYSRDRDYIRERDIRDRDLDRGWERGIRESSFERDVRGRERIRTVADLPWEREKMMYGLPRMMPLDDFYGPPSVMRDVSRQPQLNFIPPPGVDEIPDDGEVSIVSVLRLLTALEEKLGSLGPKIIDLLAQALALEKKKANSSETLLDNEINCVMFETVKEKLKGQLLAGLVDPIQERAFKKAIHKTANLIHMASERKRERTVPEPTAVAVPGVGAVDKGAIAKQLANALIAQGKTDVTQAELEQLINAVVGMAEAAKGSNKPMTTASFLSQLTGGSVVSASSEPPKEKIIIPRVKQSEDKPEKPKQKEKDPLADLEGLTEPLSPSTPERSNTSNMENLSDSDLQTLLQNFKDLSTEEQMNLINYLKKMELDEPDRVERLRKFVNLDPEKASKEKIVDLEKESSPKKNERKSPFSSRTEEINPESDSFDRKKKNDKIVHLDSEDEEEYSFEDVAKAASKNVKQKEMEDNRKLVEDSLLFSSTQKETSLTDAKTLISNLMSSFGGSSGSNVINLLGLPTSSNTTSASSNALTITTSGSSADFAKTFNSINMENLASIVSNVQKASQDQKINFEPPASITLSPIERFTNVETGFHSPISVEPPRLQGMSPTDRRSPLDFGHTRGMQGPPMERMMSPRGPMQQGSSEPGRTGPIIPTVPGALPHNPGQLLQLISGQNMPMNMGPRQMNFTQRGPVPNQFGNSSFMNQRPLLRLQFNPNFNNNPRFGGPRGPVFNNRW